MRTDTLTPPSAPFAPLSNPLFRAIWLAGLVSDLGWLIQTVAMSWVMATISSSNLMVALVQAASTLPPFIFSVFAGAIVDSYSRRNVMLIARALMSVAGAVLTIVVALGFLNPWIILGFSFLAGCGIAFNDPAWQASVGDIVDRHELPAALTLTSVGFNTVRSVGPALGGVILATLGPVVAFAIYTLCFLAPLIVIWHRKWQVRSSSLPRESLSTVVADGVRFAMLSAEIKTAIGRSILFGFAGISIHALLPLVVRDHLGAGPVAYGALMAGFGVGALLAGTFSGALRRRLSEEFLVKVACFACAACSITLALTSSLSVAAIALALGGAGWVFGWSGFNISVQWASPRWIVGRTVSIYSALSYGGLAAGSWVWGTIAEKYSVSVAMEGSAGALLLVAASGLFLPLLERSNSDLTPLEGAVIPSVALDVQPRSGPIVVKTTYIIPPENTGAFLGLMRQRRHVLSRIGARQWVLLRNLQDPSRWTESYRTPTWANYLRLNNRLTADDMLLDERLVRLHEGTLPPTIDLSIQRQTAPERKSAHFRPNRH